VDGTAVASGVASGVELIADGRGGY